MNEIRELTWEDHNHSFREPVADCRVLSDEELDQVGGGPLPLVPVVVNITVRAAPVLVRAAPKIGKALVGGAAALAAWAGFKDAVDE